MRALLNMESNFHFFYYHFTTLKMMLSFIRLPIIDVLVSIFKKLRLASMDESYIDTKYTKKMMTTWRPNDKNFFSLITVVSYWNFLFYIIFFFCFTLFSFSCFYLYLGGGVGRGLLLIQANSLKLPFTCSNIVFWIYNLSLLSTSTKLLLILETELGIQILTNDLIIHKQK